MIHIIFYTSIFKLLVLRYKWCTTLFKIQVYNIVVHKFLKSYTPFIVIISIDYIPCIGQYTLVAYFIANNLYLLLPNAVPPFFPFPSDNH